MTTRTLDNQAILQVAYQPSVARRIPCLAALGALLRKPATRIACCRGQAGGLQVDFQAIRRCLSQAGPESIALLKRHLQADKLLIFYKPLGHRVAARRVEL